VMYSLQNYSTYSIFSGVKDLSLWVKRAKELGYKSLGLCDKQTLSGLIKFQVDCLSRDIKPILGVEVLLYDSIDRSVAQDSVYLGSLQIYAKDETGFKNLIKINNASHDPEIGFYYRARVDINLLAKFKEGLICVNSSSDGVKNFESLYEIYGEDFYLGVNPNLKEDSIYLELNNKFIQSNLKKIFTFNCHYPEASDHNLYDVVRVVDNNSDFKKNFDREVFKGYLPDFRSQNIDDVFLNMKQEAEDNLNEINEKVNYIIPMGKYYMPKPKLKSGDLKADIINFIGEGFKSKILPSANFKRLESFEQLYEFKDQVPTRYLNISSEDSDKSKKVKPISEYIDRLEYELKIIEDTGFLDYFHIIHDLCSKNKERGAGRGSAAGSLVSYLLDITDIDPIFHSLLFERFLNPSRKDLPDIDIDFSQSSISEVKSYISKTYGKNRVFPIITYNRFKVASAIKKIAAAYSYAIPDNEGNLLQYNPMSLNTAVKVGFVKQTAKGEDELKERLEYSNFAVFYEKHSKWFDEVIMPLLDTVTGPGIHAAGSIILNEDRDNCLPVEYNKNYNGFVSQWVDKDCERRGFPKFDLLTITALDVVNKAKDIIYKRHGVELPSISEIPLDDKLALSIFKEGRTGGIFQFNTYTQKVYMPTLNPNSFDDLVACVAIRRPGTMNIGVDIEFAEVKNGLKPLKFDHPDLKDVLKETYGFMIYQESMMQIVQKIGKMTPSQAEEVRRACGKKLLDKMAELESVFVEGAVDAGYESNFVNSLWDKIKEFAEYSFNKSHSVSYTMLSFYQAYIKARYPAEYWCAALEFSNDSGEDSDSSFTSMKYDAATEGIDFIYPTVKKFSKDFFPYDNSTIIWPLSRLKGIGSRAIEEICKNNRSSFQSMEEMLELCDKSYLRKNNYDALIKAGFFDPILRPWQAARKYYKLRKEQVPYEMDHEDVYEWVMERNSVYGMIVKPWKSIFPFHKNVRFYRGNSMGPMNDGAKVFIGGFVKDLRIRRTKRGGWYARATIIDEDEEHTVMFWSEFWENEELDIKNNRPEKGCLVELIGKKDSYMERVQIGVDSIDSYVKVVRF
jgi:DNA polymerase III subunit alpha